MTAPPVALITGATGGLGSAIVQRLAREGYHLSLFGRDDGRLGTLTATLPTPSRVAITVGDVTELADVQRAVRWTEITYGRLDLLVCAHGAAPVTTPSVEVTPWAFEHLWQTDVLGTFLACQATAPVMRASGGGAMVLLSSIHAFQTYPQRAIYASAKAGILGMMRAFALEWGPWGITVNAIAPWQCEGARTQRFIEAAAAEGVDLTEAYLRKSPLRRLIRPEDVAEAVLFLARGLAMTGQCLILDGGVSASMWYHPFTEAGESGGG